MVRRTGTATITAGASSALTWQEAAISDSAYYTWSGTDLTVEQTGIYVAWFGIVPDADWPASASGYIDWHASPGGAGNSTMMTLLAPFGAHTVIDVFSPSFAISGLVGTGSVLRISDAPCNVTGVVENETASSFVVGVLATMFLYRLCDVIDFA